MTAAEIEARLLALLVTFDGPIPPDQLQDMRELCRAGEAGVALENFTTQLDEYEVFISPNMLEEIEQLGRAMGLDSVYWMRLRVRVARS